MDDILSAIFDTRQKFVKYLACVFQLPVFRTCPRNSYRSASFGEPAAVINELEKSRDQLLQYKPKYLSVPTTRGCPVGEVSEDLYGFCEFAFFDIKAIAAEEKARIPDFRAAIQSSYAICMCDSAAQLLSRIKLPIPDDPKTTIDWLETETTGVALSGISRLNDLAMLLSRDFQWLMQEVEPHQRTDTELPMEFREVLRDGPLSCRPPTFDEIHQEQEFWASKDDVISKTGHRGRTLDDYRSPRRAKGISLDKCWGCDHDGRWWRKGPTQNDRVHYVRSTIDG